MEGGQRHPHAGGRVGAGALGHHIGDGPGHLVDRPAFDELDLGGVDPPVQNPDQAVLVPGNILVAEQEAQAVIVTLLLIF